MDATLADPTGALVRDLDVLIESDGMAERGAFVVNPEGRIVAYECWPEMWAGMPRT